MGHPEDNSERSSWFGRLHLSWPMLLLAGWLLYEFTSQSGLAALVACAKFGWTDVRTAFWLRRVDPDRMRGQTCFWCYLTYGLWKIAIMATLTMILLGFAGALFDRAQRAPQANPGLSPVLGGALAAAAVGFGLSFPTAYIALWHAWRHGIRIWLGQAPNRARKERFWPPYHRGVNAAPFVGFTALILTLWFIIFLAMAVAVLLQLNGLGVAVFWMTTLLTSFLVFTCGYHLSPQIIARSPQECWSLVEEEAVYQDRETPEVLSER